MFDCEHKTLKWKKSENKFPVFGRTILNLINSFPSIRHKVLYLIVLLQIVVGATASFCEYYTNSRYGYGCEYTDYGSSSIDEVTEIEGLHMDGKTDNDVEFIEAHDSVIHKIPNIIFQKYVKLNRFDFQNVQLATLDESSFRGAVNLKFINLNFNKITKIPDRVFQFCSKIEQIFMQSNNINSIDLNAFDGLTNKLTILNLNNNKIEGIQYEHFRPLTNLKELYLYNNVINVIHPETFKSLSKLVFLYIHNNQLSYVHSDVLKPLVSLKTLYARENKCINKDFPNIKNINTEVIPHFSKCVDNYNSPSTTTETSVHPEKNSTTEFTTSHPFDTTML